MKPAHTTAGSKVIPDATRCRSIIDQMHLQDTRPSADVEQLHTGEKNPPKKTRLALCNELHEFPSWGGSTLQPLWHVASLYKLTTSWTGREECHEVTDRSLLACLLARWISRRAAP